MPVDLCNSHKGRLIIQPTGVVMVQAERAFSDAQCFTSLDGATYATNSISFTALPPQNGWTNAPFSTSNTAASDIDGTVYFKGAIATSGTNPVPFTLPAKFRPTANVYVSVDLCTAHQGRLWIQPSGVVTVQFKTAFANAQCFTSLDGASFALTTFTALTLQHFWITTDYYGGFSPGQRAGVVKASGIVYLTGDIADIGLSTNSVPFTLPVGFRPATNVYVPFAADCEQNAYVGTGDGHLWIQPSGVVTIVSAAGIPGCVSLDGVSFAVNASSFTPLTLQNGWTNAPFGTSNAAVANIDGIVHLKGAIATRGTNQLPFTLPAGFRPTTNVYVPVDLCNGYGGRLWIQPGGAVVVQETTFSHAKCLTSLDGVSFATSEAAGTFTALIPRNGWTNAPSGTSNAAVEDIDGIVHLKGAVASASGEVNTVFTLPSNFRPYKTVQLRVALCGAATGILTIQPGGYANFGQPNDFSGTVTITAETSQSSAWCLTSLDGVSFAL